MSALLPRGRVEALAAALDRAALDRTASEPAAPGTAAPDRSEPASEAGLACAVALASRLTDLGQVLSPAPPPEFRDALRGRLMAVAAVQGVGAEAPVPTPAASWRQGRVSPRGSAALAGAMAGVVAVSGVAVASSASLPGDPFYGAKRTAEAVQLRTAGDPASRGERHLELAATRLREVRALALGRGLLDATAAPFSRPTPAPSPSGELLREGMTDMDEQTRLGSRLLTDVFRDSREAGPLELLARFAEGQRAALLALLPGMTGESREWAETSLALVTAVSAQTDDLLVLVGCSDGCDPADVAPGLPPGGAAPGTVGTPAPCDCPAPVPAPPVAPPAPAPQTSHSPPASVDPGQTTPAPAAPAPTSPPAGPPAAPETSPAPGSPAPPARTPSVPGSPLPLPGGQGTVSAPPLPTPVPSLDVGELVDRLAPLGVPGSTR